MLSNFAADTPSRMARPVNVQRPRVRPAVPTTVAEIPGAPTGDAVGTAEAQVLASKTFAGAIAVQAVADGAFPVGTVLTVSATTDNRVGVCDISTGQERILGVAATASTGAGSVVCVAVDGVGAVRTASSTATPLVRGDPLEIHPTIPGVMHLADYWGSENGMFGAAMEGAPDAGEHVLNVMRFHANTN
jgi:hypothetical protein